MYKTLGIAVVLLAAFAFMSGSRSADASPTTTVSAPIVARGKLLNQTSTFSSTLFTPTESGLYRLSVYPTVTTADPNSASEWLYTFTWTDVTGQVQTGTSLVAADNHLGQFFDASLWFDFGDISSEGGAVRTFQANKGTPIMHSVSQLNGPPDNSAYSLYYTLERLE